MEETEKLRQGSEVNPPDPAAVAASLDEWEDQHLDEPARLLLRKHRYYFDEYRLAQCRAVAAAIREQSLPGQEGK